MYQTKFQKKKKKKNESERRKEKVDGCRAMTLAN
jgi:hypothetical protein